MLPMAPLTSAKKKLSAFKARTCPTLTLDPLFPAIRATIVILGTMYNVFLIVLSSKNNPDFHMISQVVFTFLYLPTSFALVVGCQSKGRRRVFGFWVGKTQVEVYLFVSALVYIVAVCTMVPAVSGNATHQTASGFYSFPWLTALGPGGLSMMIVIWIARSEPEEYGDGEDNGEAGLPAYSPVAAADSSSDDEDDIEGRTNSPTLTPVWV